MESSIEPLGRVAIEFGPLTIYWYGIIIALGASLGLYITLKESERVGIDKNHFMDLVLYAIPISIVSARIYYVVFEWDRYVGGSWWDIFAIWEGGIAIHGALIGAVLTTVVYARKKRVPFWKMVDVAALGLLVGQAIGRWGNFMNQEAHGGPVTRGFLESLSLPDWIINQMYIEGTYYHPTFLYESIWNVAGLVLLLFLRRKVSLRQGELFLSYVIWYSIGRFFIEGMRTDSLMLTSSLRMAQVISILLIIGSLLFWWYRRKFKEPLPEYEE
ncbi:prolipoprotein diacylglyceryl transferase [Halobacillus amylolyticus]|uniref:Phosphatidylglycerol--prolipoprotein diacylglyceryl transferase n=1 Tax=Halobacillus amylolyticus TaxID=2932259 RepID=A0ABY4HB28_9BACI|nr:prolipoprotein diacylglyceryl transferase [Halobacillus amylolyticus]UOR12037.1 prolipoprotein diacylglyceryl transferase [Halobacillus amylolyticus]